MPRYVIYVFIYYSYAEFRSSHCYDGFSGTFSVTWRIGRLVTENIPTELIDITEGDETPFAQNVI